MNPDQIRTTTLKALFSNDKLEGVLTLKGGTAMKLHGLTERESQDLDFSIRESIRFSKEKEGPVFEKCIQDEFNKYGYKVLNFLFKDKPATRKDGLPPYWGGYEITFSIMPNERFEQLSPKQLQNATMYAESIEGNKKRIQIDLSFDEYTAGRVSKKIDGIDVYLYSPLMIIYEKIRASCQQLPSYELASSKKTRARDLYDIYRILTDIQHVNLYDDVLNPSNHSIIRIMFDLKGVNLKLIPEIQSYKEELRRDYEDHVLPLIPRDKNPPEFDFLFSYAMELFLKLYQQLISSHY